MSELIVIALVCVKAFAAMFGCMVGLALGCKVWEKMGI